MSAERDLIKMPDYNSVCPETGNLRFCQKRQKRISIKGNRMAASSHLPTRSKRITKNVMISTTVKTPYYSPWFLARIDFGNQGVAGIKHCRK